MSNFLNDGRNVSAFSNEPRVPTTALTADKLVALRLATTVEVRALPADVSGLAFPALLLDGRLSASLGDTYTEGDPNLAGYVEALQAQFSALKAYLEDFGRNRKGNLRYADSHLLSGAKFPELEVVSFPDGHVGLLYDTNADGLKVPLAYTLPMGKADAEKLIHELLPSKRAA